MFKKFILMFCAVLLSVSAWAAININSASEADFKALKGIGPKKAKAIVEYRQKNGAFKQVSDLANVSGIGLKTVEKLRPQLTVSGSTTSAPTKSSAAAPAAAKPQPAKP